MVPDLKFLPILRGRSQSGEAMKVGVSDCSFTWGKPGLESTWAQIMKVIESDRY